MKFFCMTIMASLIAMLTSVNDGMCSQTHNQRICVADIQLIFQQSDAEKDAKLKLSTKQEEMGATLDNIGKEIDKLNESLQRESMVMNKKGRAKKERDLRIKINDLKTLKIKFQDELDILQQKIVSDIEKAIISVASGIGKSSGYSLVINKSAVLYSDDAIDITNKVLSKYNNEYTKKKETN